jgi:hypothetical protein
VCLRTICQILKEDLGLVKKSARWVPKRTCAHCRRSLQLVHCPQHPVARTPTLFAWPGPADFFFFKKVKEGLGGQSLDQDSIKNASEGVTRSLTAVDLPPSEAGCKKYIRLGGEFVKKS